MSNPQRQLQNETMAKIIDHAKQLSSSTTDTKWREKYISLLSNDVENTYLACVGEHTDIIDKLKHCNKCDMFRIAPLTIAGIEKLFGSSPLLNKYLWQYAIHCKLIIHSVIKSMSFTDNNITDLEQDGYIEVVNSLRHYKHATGIQFTTYVFPRLNVKLIRHCRAYNNSVQKSQRFIDEERLVTKLKESNNLTYSEMLDVTGWNKNKLNSVLRRASQVHYVDVNESINTHATERDTIETQLSDSQLHSLLHDELSRKKNVMPEREIFCLLHLIGFAINPMSNSELAKHFGVSRAAVSNYKKRAIGKLQICQFA
jgi:RNA polymerase sigma factor (sigma-70 family)